MKPPVCQAVAVIDLAGPRLDRAGCAGVRVGSWTILEHTIRRLRPSQLPVVVVGGPDLDASIDHMVYGLGAGVDRRSEPDALGRCMGAAKDAGATDVVWVEPGCLFLDTGAATRTLEFRRRVGADLVAEGGLPCGTAVEVVSVEALERAAALATDPYDREHATSFIRRDRRFRTLRAVAPGPVRRPGLRLTAESPDELEFVRAVFSAVEAQGDLADLAVVIRAADRLIVRGFAERHAERSGTRTASNG